MKKKFFATLCLGLMVAGWANGQGLLLPAADTMYGREITYFYYDWMDTNLLPGCSPLIGEYAIGGGEDIYRMYTEEPLTLRGLAGSIVFSYDESGVYDHNTLTGLHSYISIYKKDSRGHFELLGRGKFYIEDVAKWYNTGGAQVRGIAIYDAYNSFESVITSDSDFVLPIYEVYFEKPIVVNGEFWVGSPGPIESVQGQPERWGCHNLMYKVSDDDFHHNCKPIQRWAVRDITPFIHHTEDGAWYELWRPYKPILFPILDTTGWNYIPPCDTMECPVPAGLHVVGRNPYYLRYGWRWNSMHGRSQLSVAPEGRSPEEGTIVEGVRDDGETETTALVRIPEDTVRYKVYVRGYCTECGLWSQWSEGVPLGESQTEGVDEAKQSGGVELSPNPARGKVEVRALAELRSISLYDSHGRLVREEVVSGERATVSLQGLSAGVYVMQVNTQAGWSQHKLVVEPTE